MDWLKATHGIERWLGRVHLLWWLAPASVIAVITAALGFLNQAPLYLLIPAALGAGAFAFSITDRLHVMARIHTKSAALIPSVVSDFLIYVDHTDQHAKIGFTPEKNVSRLRIRLDKSDYLEGLVGVGNMWSAPRGNMIADLHDVVRGVRQFISLTETGTSGVGGGQSFLQWAGTETPIAASRLYRGRIALIVDDDPEETYSFFAVSGSNAGHPALRIIGQEHFALLTSWDAGAITRSILATPS